MAAALTGQDRALHTAAVKANRELNDGQVRRDLPPPMGVAPADAQLALLDAELKVSPPSLSVFRTAAESPSTLVRVAAWQAPG